MNVAIFMFVYTVIIYALGVAVGRVSKRLDYENKE